MKNYLVITDSESDDIVAISLLLSKLSSKYDINTIYFLTTDYNTYIKKLQIEKLLKDFDYNNIITKVNYLTCGSNNDKYPNEGEGVINDNIKNKFPDFHDNHNLIVGDDLFRFFRSLTQIELIVLANIQGIPQVIQKIFHKINRIFMYGGEGIDDISYNWKRSKDDVNALFDMARGYDKNVYIITPNTIYGNEQPGILSIYNRNKDIANTYNELTDSLKMYPSIWKIIHNWCMHKKGHGLTKRLFESLIDIDEDIFNEEIESSSLLMTPADIITMIMCLDIDEENFNNNFLFDKFTNVKITDTNEVEYLNVNNENKIFHICTYNSNENFVNYIKYLINYIIDKDL